MIDIPKHFGEQISALQSKIEAFSVHERQLQELELSLGENKDLLEKVRHKLTAQFKSDFADAIRDSFRYLEEKLSLNEHIINEVLELKAFEAEAEAKKGSLSSEKIREAIGRTSQNHLISTLSLILQN